MTLQTIFWDISSSCWLKCFDCYWWKTNRNKLKDPTFDEIKIITNKLPKKGLTRITLSGGEPTLRKDLVKICKYISEKRIKPCIITSGCDEKLLKKLKPYINKIIISFRASYPELDNMMKNHSDAFSMALNTLNLCTKLKIKKSINFPISNLNFHNLDSMIKFAREHSSELMVIRFVPFTESDKNYDLSPEQVDQTYETIIKRGISKESDLLMFCREKLENQFCPSGVARLYITTNGDVMPCSLVNYKLGNLLKDDLDFILQRAEEWREEWLEREYKDKDFYRKFTHCLGYAMSCLK